MPLGLVVEDAEVIFKLAVASTNVVDSQEGLAEDEECLGE